MASWNNGGRGSSNYTQSNYNPNFPQNPNYGQTFTDQNQGYTEGDAYNQQGFYLQQVNDQSYQLNNRSYPNNGQVYRQSGSYTWYNPQFVQQGYQQQEYIPSYVCQNASFNESSQNGEASVNPTRQYNGQQQQQGGNGGAIPKQSYNGSRKQNSGGNSGANRLYRNPNLYYGTPQQQQTNSRSGVEVKEKVGGDSKTEDRKKLLAEVATLLNPEKRSIKTATRIVEPPQPKEKSKGWAATPNYQAKPNKKEYKRNDTDVRKSESRREPETQRERLIEQLTRGKLECLVCCERLRQTVAVWSCQNCYHVLHLGCVSKWALTSTTKTEGIRLRQETSWRCPACQHTYDTLPDKYTCFCTKYISPKWIKGETPHCCGEVCGKARKSCAHPCTLLCHPGPCPPCTATVQRECGCGRTRQSIKCSSTVSLECDLLCGKMLDCGRHDCLLKCHQGPCKPCQEKQKQECHCGRESKEMGCGSAPHYSCGSPCRHTLDCNKHNCTAPCHPGPCASCPWDPNKITTCHCGAKTIKRHSCTEPVLSCGNKCSKKCPSCLHECSETCHPGPCPPCSVPITSPCRCGHTSSVQTTCHKFNTLKQLPVCKKKCTKKRQCGKHKCNMECCNETVHTCTLLCNKTLSCGQHKCELLCHRGNCNPCTRLGFDEMRCHCGFSVLYPPIDCGTRPPECRQPCTREHDCSHPPTHTCHSLPQCPPCTVLVSRSCYGNHETRKAVPCYIAEYSCGLPCGKLLPCQHRCIDRCHGGECPAQCRQACPRPRDLCGHACSLPCHAGTPCTGQAPCLAQLEVSCACGRRKQVTTCADFRRTWARHQASTMAANKETIVDPTKVNIKVLECDEECKLYERNLRLAIGLQIANPDLSNKLKPQYSESMRGWAKRDPRFCDMVHNKLTQLVQLAKQSKQKSRSFSFDVMSGVKRQFVHEYCKHFGCESVAYDAEPKRNVVATANKDKCWLPSYSLLEMIQRENGQRKVPLPSLNRKELPGEKNVYTLREEREAVQLPLSKLTLNQPMTPSAQSTPRPASPHIDYFDFTPTPSSSAS